MLRPSPHPQHCLQNCFTVLGSRRLAHPPCVRRQQLSCNALQRNVSRRGGWLRTDNRRVTDGMRALDTVGGVGHMDKALLQLGCTDRLHIRVARRPPPIAAAPAVPRASSSAAESRTGRPEFVSSGPAPCRRKSPALLASKGSPTDRPPAPGREGFSRSRGREWALVGRGRQHLQTLSPGCALGMHSTLIRHPTLPLALTATSQ